MERVGLTLSSQGRALLWRPLDDGVTSIGRNPDCDLCIPDERVAPVHLLLRKDGSTVVLVNRHHSGVQVGGHWVNDELRLAEGDSFALGPMLLTLESGAIEQPAAPAHNRTLTLGTPTVPPTTYVVTAPRWRPDAVWQLTDSGLTIGAGADCDIVLDDPYVSTLHARVSLEHGRPVVQDLDSRNGIFCGERKLREGEVPEGAELRLGRTILVLTRRDGQAPPAHDDVTRQLVGKTAVIEALRDQLRKVAATDAPVMVTGDTGTGKEVVARLLAALSPRAKGPFIALNCGALGHSLIESELFGHEKGAFTGAVARKAGAFEAADGGTLFLDELGELPLELQPQLLRVLESGEVRRVGSTSAFRVDVRLIAATNRRLHEEVRAGKFREDLYHRLHVLVLELPPLRERKEDIPELAHHFVAQLAPKGERLVLLPDAVERLVAHDWPGNVRELRNVIQRAVLMRSGNILGATDITFTQSTLLTRVQAAHAKGNKTLSQLERDAIIAELLRCEGSKTEAAAALGISRSTIHRKIGEHGIDVDALLGRKQ